MNIVQRIKVWILKESYHTACSLLYAERQFSHRFFKHAGTSFPLVYFLFCICIFFALCIFYFKTLNIRGNFVTDCSNTVTLLFLSCILCFGFFVCLYFVIFSCPEQLNRTHCPLLRPAPLTIRVFTTPQSDPRDL